MLSLSTETPEALIGPLEALVLADWEATGRTFGDTRDPIADAEGDGWCVVRAPACHVSVAREPFVLWVNPLEIRLAEWPAERRTRPRQSVSRLAEAMPRAAEEMLALVATRMEIGRDPVETARAWLQGVDWRLAGIDPAQAARAQRIVDAWRGAGSTESQVDRELFLAADREVRQWADHARAQALLLRLMLSPSTALGPEIQTAARGALEQIEALIEEMLRASSPDLLFEPGFRRRLQETLRVYTGLMDHCARLVVIPGGRSPFPTAGQSGEIDLRFRLPPRLLHLWVRRTRRVAAHLDRGSMRGYLDADLVSVHPDALDEARHDLVLSAVLLAAVMLQYNQGPPELQEEMAQAAESALPLIDHPTRIGLHPSDRGTRAQRQRALLPLALGMGRELARRGLSLALGRPDVLARLSTPAHPLHHCFPFKLGPEQPLPLAHLLTARSFDEVAPVFA